MATFIRFQTDICDRGACQGLGIFRAIGLLEEQEQIETCFQETIEEILHWFNRNLRLPRIAEQHRQCVFWFRTDEQLFVHRLWDLVAILKEHGIDVRKMRTTDPGMIVYRDDHQIAAVPNRQTKHALRV